MPYRYIMLLAPKLTPLWLPPLLLLWSVSQVSADDACHAFNHTGICFDSKQYMTDALTNCIGDAIAASGDKSAESVYEQ